MRHFLYIPFTGLGLYGGYRGKRWLRNRIEVFKRFVVPSLLSQTDQNFTIWVSWRRQDKLKKEVQALLYLLQILFGRDRVVFTYHGVCFWDDKYTDEEANSRLMTSLHHSLTEIVNHVGDVENVIMTIQPSDDVYNKNMVATVQNFFKESEEDAVGYKKGYIMNYQTGDVKEYNPKTNPPFFSIRFKKQDFIDPFKHAQHTGPYKSHEYIGDHLKYAQLDGRGFLVGTHGENISTHFNHPYGGNVMEPDSVYHLFWDHPPKTLKIRYSLRKQLMRKLPHGWQRKLRYIFGERFYAIFYKWIRG